jgi:hypothetical protein
MSAVPAERVARLREELFSRSLGDEREFVRSMLQHVRTPEWWARVTGIPLEKLRQWQAGRPSRPPAWWEARLMRMIALTDLSADEEAIEEMAARPAPTYADLERYIAALGSSRSEAAVLLGVGPQEFSYWKAGRGRMRTARQRYFWWLMRELGLPAAAASG